MFFAFEDSNFQNREIGSAIPINFLQSLKGFLNSKVVNLFAMLK